MPYSTTLFKEEIKQHIIKHIDNRIKLLDVGAGCGTYAHLLRGHFERLDAIEIHQPNIQKFGLDKLYREVFLGNVLEFDFNENPYGYVIMGDVIEHMSVPDAQGLISKLDKKGRAPTMETITKFINNQI
jgi:2-polyprenyl-3-methyl-5-hydroxy-6-metoxy-1,4-benzoquinol methylase